MDPITIIGWACLVGVFAFSVLRLAVLGDGWGGILLGLLVLFAVLTSWPVRALIILFIWVAVEAIYRLLNGAWLGLLLHIGVLFLLTTNTAL